METMRLRSAIRSNDATLDQDATCTGPPVYIYLFVTCISRNTSKLQVTEIHATGRNSLFDTNFVIDGLYDVAWDNFEQLGLVTSQQGCGSHYVLGELLLLQRRDWR